MSNTRPFTEAHAIASVDLGILFPAELPTKSRESLAQAFSTQLLKEGFVPEEADDDDLIGFQRKSSAEDSDVAEQVHVHDDFIHVVTYDYRGWSLTRDQLLARLEPALRLVRQGEISPQYVGLTFRDVFVNSEPATYAAADVFARVNHFLPAFTFEVGDTWRHSSWWDEAPKTAPTRNFLTIDARQRRSKRGKGRHFTEITHGQRLSGNKSKDPAVTWETDRLRTRLDQAHQRNKAILMELLSGEMVEKVGLKEGT